MPPRRPILTMPPNQNLPNVPKLADCSSFNSRCCQRYKVGRLCSPFQVSLFPTFQSWSIEVGWSIAYLPFLVVWLMGGGGRRRVGAARCAALSRRTCGATCLFGRRPVRRHGLNAPLNQTLARSEIRAAETVTSETATRRARHRARRDAPTDARSDEHGDSETGHAAVFPTDTFKKEKRHRLLSPPPEEEKTLHTTTVLRRTCSGRTHHLLLSSPEQEKTIAHNHNSPTDMFRKNAAVISPSAELTTLRQTANAARRRVARAARRRDA